MAVNSFDDAIKIIPYRIRNILSCFDNDLKMQTYELRIRNNRPLIMYGKYGSVFVKNDYTYSKISYQGAIYITQQDIDEIISASCDYSVYSKQNELLNGYISYGKGHRIGISGEVLTENGRIVNLKNIESLCIRIASTEIIIPESINDVLKNPFEGIIICGRPCSGKTTMLRAIAEKLSNESVSGVCKLVIIDERNELATAKALNCDVLKGCSKRDGIIHAIRTLSPEIIICDEISTCEEVEKISEAFHSGVRFIVSVHISSVDDLYKRKVSSKLIESGCFDKFIILDNCENAGKIKEVFCPEKTKL